MTALLVIIGAAALFAAGIVMDMALAASRAPVRPRPRPRRAGHHHDRRRIRRMSPARPARVCDCPGCSCVGVSRDYMRAMHGDTDAPAVAGRLHLATRVALTLLWVAFAASAVLQGHPFSVCSAAALVVLTWWEARPWWLILAAGLFATLGLVFET